eukprot:gene13771-16831_t
MSIAAGLCSYLLVTREARLGLNGPQVIEQEAGIEEYDSRDRPFIWSLTGGEQRMASELVDGYVADDIDAIREALGGLLASDEPPLPRSRRHAWFLERLARLGDDCAQLDAAAWLHALAGDSEQAGYPASVKVIDGEVGSRAARFIAVVADAANPFPRARNGEVGLLEGWGLAKAVDDAIEADAGRGTKRVLVAVVD